MVDIKEELCAIDEKAWASLNDEQKILVANWIHQADINGYAIGILVAAGSIFILTTGSMVLDWGRRAIKEHKLKKELKQFIKESDQ